MGIVTKKGDKGRTRLFLGGDIDKDSLRVEFLGCLDELTSFIGLAKSQVRSRRFKGFLESIQKDILCICKEAATLPKFLGKIGCRLGRKEVSLLENSIGCLEGKNKKGCFRFCLPGKNSVSSVLHVSRTVARKTERLAVKLTKKRSLKNNYILSYLNRLSDLLFLLARECEDK